MLHQRVGLGEDRGPPIGQAILCSARPPLLSDAIGIGECQQVSDPSRMTGITDGLGRPPSQERAVLSGELPCALDAALRAALGAELAGEHGQAAMKIGSTASRDIPLAQQSGDVASEVAQALGMAPKQQMGNTWMCRQLSHRLAMLGEAAIGLQSPQTLQQISGLRKRRRWREIEPFQLSGRHAPTSELQGQPGKIRLENLGSAECRHLLVLRL